MNSHAVLPQSRRPASLRETHNAAILDRLDILQGAVMALAERGFYVERVDLGRIRPTVVVRHTRQCQDLPAHLKSIVRSPDGERQIFQAELADCWVEWTQLGPWAYRERG